eukprot:COSAG02_NODE_64795_length_259_cov_1.037500_1_plen_51_part_10
MNNDERQLMQVKMIKEDPNTADYTKVWIYRNMVYAYPWCVHQPHQPACVPA